VIDDYFRALAETMSRQSELMGRLYTHRGALGENREALVARFLNSYLPACYGVSSGFALLGAELSTQQDVVVYERLTNPVLFPDSAAPLFPPGALAASIEVKSQLTRGELYSATEKAWRLKRELRRALARHPKPPEREALAALFAFRSRLNPAAVLALMREHEHRGGVEVRDRLDLVCVLNVGVVVGGSLWTDALRRQRSDLADAEAIAVGVDDSLFVFYTCLVDFLARRPPTPPQLMSYLPLASPMGIVVATG
jgi:hypothetical protein